jgi:hypothetical protein
MWNRVLLRVGLPVAVVLSTASLPVFAQAAAESALIHSLSSTATVHAGSSLGRALNESGTQLGVRIQQRTSNALPTRTVQSAQRPVVMHQVANNVHVGPTPGMAAVAVQGGGQGACAPPANVQATDHKTVPASTTAACGSGNSANPPRVEDKYKSFVTLSFPK